MAGLIQKRVLATLRSRNPPLIKRGFASDALATAEINPGEVGIVSGIPEQHLRRRVTLSLYYFSNFFPHWHFLWLGQF